MRKRSGILYIFCLVVCVCVFAFAAVQIFRQLAEDAQAEAQQTALTAQVVTVRTEEPPQNSETEQPSPEEVPEEVTVPLQVDFPALLQRNGDVIGWLYCEGTPINYPLVQSTDNSKYLRRLLDGSYNRAGTIFADYRNRSDFSDWNTLVYGHNMKNDTMFGTFPLYREQTYYDAHPVLWLLTPEVDYRVDLIAGYYTRADAAIYAIAETRQERDILLTAAEKLSTFLSHAEVGPEDRLITFSTCTYEQKEGRYVLLGVLRPVE